jgi:hypothetical protein
LLGEFFDAQKKSWTTRSAKNLALMSELLRFSAGSFREQNNAAPTSQLFPAKPAAHARPPQATNVEAGFPIFFQRREVSVEVYEIHGARGGRWSKGLVAT